MAEIDVLEGAFRIAREEYPQLDIPAYRARVDAFARQARLRVTGRARGAIEKLNDFFFGALGFRGNTDDYYDPRNSFLNDVIDRRTGIPITLSTVYCEIGRQLGLPTYGVGFPGHFLVKCPSSRGEVLIDCFSGKILSRRDCQALLESLYPGRMRLSDSMLQIAAPRDILSRMLNNLRRVHSARKEFAKAIRWIELDLELKPDAFQNYRDRGMLYIQLEQFGKALEDLERYVDRVPEAPDRAQVNEQVQLLRKLISHLN